MENEPATPGSGALRPETTELTLSHPVQDVRLLARAVARGWVRDEVGIGAVEELWRIGTTYPDMRVRVAALKGIIAAGMRDARVEATRVQEAGQENNVALAALRAYLATDEGRKAALSGEIPSGGKNFPPDETTAVQQSDACDTEKK